MEIVIALTLALVSLVIGGYVFITKTRVSAKTCNARREGQDKNIQLLNDCIDKSILDQKDRYKELREDMRASRTEIRADVQTGFDHIHTKVDQLCSTMLACQKRNSKPNP